MVLLNEELAKRQKITQKQRDKLDKLYSKLAKLVKKASRDKDIKNNGWSYTLKMEELEYKLQKNWNFPQNKLFHTWWNSFEDCTCPKMDNLERFGYDKIYNYKCPFHKHS